MRITTGAQFVVFARQYFFSTTATPLRFQKHLKKYSLWADEIDGLILDWEEKGQLHTRIVEV